MPRAKMQYVIFVEDDSEKEPVMYAAPVPDGDYEFLQGEVIPTMRPMSDEQYMKGPAVILHTLARFSYILASGESRTTIRPGAHSAHQNRCLKTIVAAARAYRVCQ